MGTGVAPFSVSGDLRDRLPLDRVGIQKLNLIMLSLCLVPGQREYIVALIHALQIQIAIQQIIPRYRQTGGLGTIEFQPRFLPHGLEGQRTAFSELRNRKRSVITKVKLQRARVHPSQLRSFAI